MYIRDFLVNGVFPDQREIIYEDWGAAGIQAYVPRIYKNAYEFGNLLETFWAIDSELIFQPKYYYNNSDEDVSVACPYGGSFSFRSSDLGDTYSFKDCAYTQGFVMTGTGSSIIETGLFTIEAQVSGDKSGKLIYTQDYSNGGSSVSGEYGGKEIDLKE